MALLEVEDLHVEFNTFGGTVKAVRGVGFSVDDGETLAIVGNPDAENLSASKV